MEVAQITWEECEKMGCKTKGTIIDIRSKEDYQKGHVENAIHISAEEIEAGVSLPKGILFLYCDTGIQSLSMVRFLMRKGYRAVNIKGGYLRYLVKNKDGKQGSKVDI